MTIEFTSGIIIKIVNKGKLLSDKLELIQNSNKMVKSIVYDMDYINSITIEFLSNNKEKNIEFHSFGKIVINRNDIERLKQLLENNEYIFQETGEYFLVYSDNVVMKFKYNNNGLDEGSMIYTSIDEQTKLVDIIDEIADTSRKLEIRWYTDMKCNYHNIVETYADSVYDSMYPNIPNGIDDYIDTYLKSKSSILVLLGLSGTGKTGFIRYLLSKMEKKAFLTYNHDIFKNDDMFAEFVSSSSAGAFIIEDADILLKSRESGNELMAKILNFGDGVLKMYGKKIVFSTNLPSTKDIDEALLRAGRCFDVLEFRKMTFDEANKACKDLNLEELTENKEYKLTEIFNRGVMKKQKSIGFI